MKKILMVILCLTFLTSTAFAATVSGPARWALNDTQYLTGINSTRKVENAFGLMRPADTYVYGFVKDGVEYEKGVQTTFTFDKYVAGLTTLNTVVNINPQYENQVKEIVYDVLHLDDGAKLTANDYVKATLYLKHINKVPKVGHVFFDNSVEKILVGTITLNQGKNVFDLFIGDFNHDNKYELGFAAAK